MSVFARRAVLAFAVLLEFAPLSAREPLRVWCALGDAFTAGTGLDPAESWPRETLRLLRRMNGGDRVRLEVIAREGWTAADVRTAWAAEAPKADYDLVTIMVGANDLAAARPLDGFRLDLDKLTALAVERTGGRTNRVLLVSIPDFSVTPAGRRMEEDAVARSVLRYNRVLRDVAAKRTVAFLDITPLSREGNGAADLIAPDGIHFSARMHRLWADLIAGQLASMRAQPDPKIGNASARARDALAD